MSLRTDIAITTCDLYERYISDHDAPPAVGRRPDDRSITRRLRDLYDEQIKPPRGEYQKPRPGPRPPGVLDAMLALDEVDQIARGWYEYATNCTAPASRAGLLLPDVIHEDDLHDVLSDLRSARRTGLLALGLARSPVALRGVLCPACGQAKLFYEPVGSDGVWCAAGGTTGCHDDERYAGCRSSDGTLTCRRAPRSTRHCVKIPFGRLEELRVA